MPNGGRSAAAVRTTIQCKSQQPILSSDSYRQPREQPTAGGTYVAAEAKAVPIHRVRAKTMDFADDPGCRYRSWSMCSFLSAHCGEP